MFKDINIIWKNVYREKLKNVQEGRIVTFNFKVLNNILATPHKLWRWKICDTNICHLCFSEGNLEHMMIKCPYFSEYYEYVKSVLKRLGYENVKLDMYSLVCGHKPNVTEYKLLNLILNIVFFNVYKCWVKIKINRVYLNPIEMLKKECRLRKITTLYSNLVFIAFVNILEA